MTKTVISTLLYLFDDAFQGNDWESLLANLKSVTPADWLWIAPDGRRSICEIVAHVGGCKYMYPNQALGDGQFTWDDPLVSGSDALASVPVAIQWLREGQARLIQSIAALDDS